MAKSSLTLNTTYSETIDRESAYELLEEKTQQREKEEIEAAEEEIEQEKAAEKKAKAKPKAIAKATHMQSKGNCKRSNFGHTCCNMCVHNWPFALSLPCWEYGC